MRSTDRDRAGGTPTVQRAGTRSEGVFGRGIPRWLHALILVGAVPLIVPSLLINLLMAKRWGRIPVPLIIFDFVLLVGLSIRGPRLLPVFLVATACTLTLAVVRYRKLGSGVYLGYSNRVAFGLMGAGILFLVGLFKTFSFVEIAGALDQTRLTVGAAAIASYSVKAGERVTVTDPLAWEQRAVWAPEAESARLREPDATAAGEIWVPFVNGQRQVWLALPEGGEPPGPPIDGVVTAPSPAQLDSMLALLRARHPNDMLRDGIYIVRPSSQEPAAPPPRSWDAVGLALLGLGLVLAAGVISLALRE